MMTTPQQLAKYRAAARKAAAFLSAATGIKMSVESRSEIQPCADGAYVSVWVWVPNDLLAKDDQKDLDSSVSIA